MTARIDFEIPADAKQAKCRSCDAPIVFMRTPRGKAMPLDLASMQVREGKRFAEAHFARCPEAARWRSGKASP